MFFLTSSYNFFQMTTEYIFLICHDLRLCWFHINNYFLFLFIFTCDLQNNRLSTFQNACALAFNVNVFSFKCKVLKILLIIFILLWLNCINTNSDSNVIQYFNWKFCLSCLFYIYVGFFLYGIICIWVCVLIFFY